LKITNIKTQIVSLPFKKTITTAIHTMSSVGCVLLTIETNEGIEGQSYLFSLNSSNIDAYNEALVSFSSKLIGKDPQFVKTIWQDIWSIIDLAGRSHIAISALSTIDTALWDINAKTANLPLHRLFGFSRSKIKTYASGGLWLSQSLDSILAEAQGFLDQGFLAMKIRIGSANWLNDLERIGELRKMLGNKIELMADLNQSLKTHEAIRLGKELEEYNLLWLEEPVSSSDRSGHAEVRKALNIPIASGENEYTHYDALEMLETKACDILMPDLQRIGGLSEMRKVAHISQDYSVPISTHIFTEQSLCIAGSVDNCISVEHMPWFADLFNEKIDVIKGDIEIPERPGIGFTFNKDYVNQLVKH
jgi:L-alanine-DL-glutamate epimerase-like enolase superfamily enzyme